MKAFLLIAHGSRLQASNDEVVALKNSLETKLTVSFDLFEASFLELCEPSISQAIDKLVSAGVDELIVMPYFLNQGRHVTEDVPNELLLKCNQYPELTITSLPYFGRSELIPHLLKQIIEQEV